MTLPSGPIVVPRLLSTNSPLTCSVLMSTVSTRDGGIEAQCKPVNTIIRMSSAMMAITMYAQRRSAATDTASDP